jgi:Family of unknown function (DUF5681)
MFSSSSSNGNNGQKGRKRRTVSATPGSAKGYKVGPGRPPREYQFKPGQSGNPKGAKPKPPLLPDLKRLFEQALSEKVTLRQGEKERTLTMAEAGIKQLVAQFAKGDRHARRDVFAYAEMLGIDLITSHRTAIEEALASNHQAILEAYVARQYDKVVKPAPALAPPELLDDDPEDRNGG